MWRVVNNALTTAHLIFIYKTMTNYKDTWRAMIADLTEELCDEYRTSHHDVGSSKEIDTFFRLKIGEIQEQIGMDYPGALDCLLYLGCSNKESDQIKQWAQQKLEQELHQSFKKEVRQGHGLQRK